MLSDDVWDGVGMCRYMGDDEDGSGWNWVGCD